MEHRLDIKSGKNEFDRQLRNFRVHVHRDDEGENVAVITASVMALRHLSEHQRSSGIPTTIDISSPAARGFAIGGFHLTGGPERRTRATS